MTQVILILVKLELVNWTLAILKIKCYKDENFNPIILLLVYRFFYNKVFVDFI